jgi:hypothetical protein
MVVVPVIFTQFLVVLVKKDSKLKLKIKMKLINNASYY